ncbi:hypothetical protein E1B28_000204 [Marasmius oreades]|uniref:Uncharacterized protein n=1 Tax=Marasmius oreades TaxID=181124 RepID=A0A9P7V110_9AGAR|nr:uncharacterized protein E1B28_000204 [Marasmius oreades]KAG7098240.1 hypothetical protein E1B28_000204 [Marasmius oreades]
MFPTTKSFITLTVYFSIHPNYLPSDLEEDYDEWDLQQSRDSDIHSALTVHNTKFTHIPLLIADQVPEDSEFTVKLVNSALKVPTGGRPPAAADNRETASSTERHSILYASTQFNPITCSYRHSQSCRARSLEGMGWCGRY